MFRVLIHNVFKQKQKDVLMLCLQFKNNKMMLEIFFQLDCVQRTISVFFLLNRIWLSLTLIK